ncbi:tetratricopeptide repeat protein [Novipirellula sp. SH528]|uniref:tetratricopeptide repeat protein n=1 Tax=Novipirellula sp. SH528 TaxID=3454466 RepID=UPI003FA0391D
MTNSSLRFKRKRPASTKVAVLVLGCALSALVIADVSLTSRQAEPQLPSEVQSHPDAVAMHVADNTESPLQLVQKSCDSTSGCESPDKIDSPVALQSSEPIPAKPAPVVRSKASFVFNRTTIDPLELRDNTSRPIPVKFATHPIGDRSVIPVSNSEPPLLPIPVSRRVKSTATLPYTTSMESQLKCRQLLDQAAHEYRVKAWLSAETSTWAALTHAVEGVQIATREAANNTDERHDPLVDLQRARTALTEVRDFAEQSTSAHQIDMETIVRSHRTKVLRNVDLDGITSTRAIEAYLDDARQTLANLASESVQAAEAMDLLAAIYLTRDDKRTLPSSTSLCLRRAALQGQPENANLASNLGMQLARVGMLTEAQRVLQHSVSLRNDPATQVALAGVLQQLGQFEAAAKVKVELQATSYPTTEFPKGIRIPEVIQLSPAEFAAVSNSVMQTPAGSQRAASQVPAIAASVKQNRVTHTPTGPGHPNTVYTDMSASGSPAVPSMDDVEGNSEPAPSAFRRTWNSVRNLW